MQRDDLTGKIFGELTVLDLDTSRQTRPFWYCKCSCGNKKSIAAKHLKSGAVKTCRASIHKVGSLNPNWNGYQEIGQKHWSLIQRNAALRNLPVTITLEDIWTLFLEQNRKCALSNVEISLVGKRTASLDRIDSSKGYVQGNVQWVHKTVNKMKMEMSQEIFIKFCKKIAKNA